MILQGLYTTYTSPFQNFSFFIEGQFSFKLKSLSTVDLNLMSNKSSVSIGQKKCVFFSNLTTNQNSSKNAKLYCIPISKKQKPHYGGKNYEFYLMYLCVYSFVHFRWLITSFPLFYFRTPWLGSSLMIIELLSSHQLQKPLTHHEAATGVPSSSPCNNPKLFMHPHCSVVTPFPSNEESD